MTEFTRIFSPKTERAVKAISLLTNGAKYKPTEKEIEYTLSVLKDAVNDIAQLYGVLPGGQIVAKDVPAATTEERIGEKERAIKDGGWPYLAIDARVRSIPENQLSIYITQIMARLCDKFDGAKPEAKPKNYLPAEPTT